MGKFSSDGKIETSRLTVLRYGKRASADWTVGKLLTIILVVVLLALMVYGFSSKAIYPLKDKIVMMWDNTLGMFGFGDKDSGSDEFCEEVVVDDVGSGTLCLSQDYCKVFIDGEGIKDFYLKSGKLSYYVEASNTYNFLESEPYNSLLKNPSVAKLERKMYYDLVEGAGGDNFLKESLLKAFGKLPKSLILRIQGDLASESYIKFWNGKWEINAHLYDKFGFQTSESLSGNKEPSFYRGVKKSDWDDEKALSFIYKEVDDWGINPDDKVYWKMGYD